MKIRKSVFTNLFLTIGKSGAKLPSRLGNYEATVPEVLQKEVKRANKKLCTNPETMKKPQN